jgi:hypothetical protein
MKILSFLAAFMLLSFAPLKAQTYFPFIENSKIWSVANIMYYFPIPNYRIITTHSYKFNGDTLSYNGNTYFYLYECNSDPSTGNWGYDLAGYGYREENHKVYKSAYYDDFEEVIYDFSLTVGDSVYVDSIYYSPTYAHATIVDSVLVGRSFRKRIQFDNPPEVWIEGIGSLYSPFNPIRWCMQMGAGSLLLCVSDSTGNLYMSPEYNSCYLDTTMTDRKENGSICSEVKIMSNPMHESCVINTGRNAGEFTSYNLYNSAGLLVQKGKIQNVEFTLQRNELPDGIYLLQLIGRNTILPIRIIIQ